MKFAYIVLVDAGDASHQALSEKVLADISDVLRTTPKMTCAHLYTPGRAQDQFRAPEKSPLLGMQIYFNSLEDLEEAVCREGNLWQLVEMEVFSTAKGNVVTQQAMYVRHFPVDHPESVASDREKPCSYLVHYPGPAHNQNSWLGHYIKHHPQIMRTFPGIRSIEVLTRVDWVGFIPWARANHMQRNRVMFDSQAALTKALHSPARNAMREDFEKFPAYEGGNYHYPMETLIIRPNSASIDSLVK
ncbi:hypothetical protein [Agrobacterium pusense]|uniref:hypothetical protein n=1 Tax=Agrobacterium pusense TaxID=648995 RepID=UPI00156AA834|nr:hypothetical protein [Agrobacterium pusense]QKJ94461.1 hypothetical protein HQN82_23880 [Agrobacterium pusense]